jgi:hypothetical protein
MRLSERLVNDSLSWMYGGNRQHHILGIVAATGSLQRCDPVWTSHILVVGIKRTIVIPIACN